MKTNLNLSLRRVGVLLVLVFTFISTTVLFQNCAEDVDLSKYSQSAGSTDDGGSDGTGGTAPVPAVLVPSSCKVEFSRCDQNCANPAAKATAESLLDGSAFDRLSLFGDVNGDDLLYLKGSSCSTVATHVDSYLSRCEIGLGHVDNIAVVAAPAAPVSLGGAVYRNAITMKFDGAEQALSLTGNVNSDDKLFVRMNCPAANAGQEAMEAFVKNNCYVCLGHSNGAAVNAPSSARCSKVRDLTDIQWNSFYLSAYSYGTDYYTGQLGYDAYNGTYFQNNDVDGDDALYLGFYCGAYPSVALKWNVVGAAIAAPANAAAVPDCMASCASVGLAGTCSKPIIDFDIEFGIPFVAGYEYFNATCGLR